MTTTVGTLPIPDKIRRRHRRRFALTVSQWAERYRMVCDGPLVGDTKAIPWSNDTFPPGVDIMDAAEQFRRLILIASAQTSGKTALATNVTLKRFHWDRRDAMYIHANAAKGRSQYGKKIGPAIAAQPELATLIPDSRDEIGTHGEHKFKGGLSIHVTGSESEGELSGSTAPTLFFDDVHAMPASLGVVGHPVEFGEKRAAAYPPEERVTICAGQATDVESWLWRSLLNSAFYVLYLPCVKCGTYQLLDWDRMVYDDSSPAAAAEDCWLRCANSSCQHEIRHEELPQMLREYRWISTPPDANPVLDPGPRTRIESLAAESVFPAVARATQDAGFWWNAFSWPLVPWTQYAADAVSAAGNPDSAHTFRQQVQVIPWEEPKVDEDAMEPDDIKAHTVDGHHWKIVPAAAGVHEGKGVVITTGDVMAGYLWYLVLAWNLSTGSSWLIECGRFGKKLEASDVPSKAERTAAWKSRIARGLEGLWAKDDEGWPVETGGGEILGNASSNRCLIDCGFLRETVQIECRRFNGGRWLGKWLPVEGAQARAGSKTPVWPGLNRPTIEAKTKRRYWVSNSNRGKLYVRDVLAIPPGNDGALHLPPNMPTVLRDQFAKHLCAEEWHADRGIWKKTSDANHLLDCMALQMAGAMCCEVRLPGIEQGPTRETRTDWFQQQRAKRKVRSES